MKIEIISRCTPDGRAYYEWDLWEGPADCTDHAHGYATDLITAFSKLLEWKERIDRDYADELTADLETAKQFTTNNDSDNEPTS
jgi:hypothetical protein